jgi:hypothetical protein
MNHERHLYRERFGVGGVIGLFGRGFGQAGEVLKAAVRLQMAAKAEQKKKTRKSK